MRVPKHYLPPLVLAVVLTGCLSAREYTATEFFLFRPEVSAVETSPLDLTLGVRALTAPLAIDTRMAYLEENHALRFAETRWAEQPPATLTRAVIDGLAASGRFADVGDAARMARPDWQLTGELRAFHADARELPHKAVLEVRFELREARGERAYWAETLRVHVPMADSVEDAAGQEAAAAARSWAARYADAMESALETAAETAVARIVACAP